MVADLLGSDRDRTVLLDSRAEPVDYDLPAITTAGRHWVRGHAAVDGVRQPFSLFVKHVQSWVRSPIFDLVPERLRADAADGVPWRTEALAYRSDLADRLPDGLRMPRSLGVFDLDHLSTSVWLEEVCTREVPWDLTRYAHVAGLLGRLAASPAVAALRDVGRYGWTVQRYLDGRLAGQVLPMLRDESLWTHPLVAAAFGGDLRDRLRAAGESAADLVAELDELPVLTAHGDACPNNLLDDGDDVVLIDYGFWGPNPVGFDLGQLLVGDVQLGRRTAADMAEVDEAIVRAYVAGLRAEGCDVDEHVVRRAHAVQLLVFAGLSAVPLELLGADPTPAAYAVAADRAAMATYCLDLVDRTSP